MPTSTVHPQKHSALSSELGVASKLPGQHTPALRSENLSPKQDVASASLQPTATHCQHDAVVLWELHQPTVPFCQYNSKPPEARQDHSVLVENLTHNGSASKSGMNSRISFSFVWWMTVIQILWYFWTGLKFLAHLFLAAF